MAVTVADLLKLPSLRNAEVVAGRGGLQKIVSSISVLESVDPELLMEAHFHNDEFYGSEIVITSFINIKDDVELQCRNIRRLAEGGEVGLILYYVGIFMKEIHP
ncbi:MAG: PucR family transcriptional regulator ligand-binding domain-containing protein, partial [Dethiobacteria bacterium]